MIKMICLVVSALSLTVALVVVLIHATIAPAHAYLDPTTASILMQAVASAFLIVGLIVKRYWTLIKTKLSLAAKGHKGTSSDGSGG